MSSSIPVLYLIIGGVVAVIAVIAIIAMVIMSGGSKK